MKPRILAVLLANLFAVSAASAQEVPFTFSGSASLGGLFSDINTTDESKAQEYRDLDNGALFGFDLKGRGGRNWVDLFGENLGRDDQFVDVNGGVYGLFKGRLYLNDIIHNQGFNLRTPYTGVGGADLRAPTTGTGNASTFNPNPDTWNTFESSIKRRNIGGYAEITPGQSVYVRVDANEAKWSGVRIIDGAFGPSPVFGYADYPSPTDYKVTTASLEAGYSSKQAHLSVSYQRSKFTNDNDLLTWTNPHAVGAIDTTVLPQDNEQKKWAINGALKQLPLGSSLAVRVTEAKTESHVPLLTSMVNTANSSAITPTPANVSTFDGDIKTRTASVALNSQPTRLFDTKIYWNQAKRENNSTDVVFVGYDPLEKFSYDKKNWGVEAGFRLPAQTKLLVGYDHTDTDRERVDFDNTKDKKFFAEVKTGAWELATMRLKVQRLERRSNFLEGDAGISTNDPELLNRYFRRFDLANVDQNSAKFAIDVAPADLLELGLEATYKKNDYKDTTLGRTGDRRWDIYGSVSYGDRDKWRITAFADAEDVTYDSFHRYVGTVQEPSGFCSAANPNGCMDPINGPTNSGSYNWGLVGKERNYMLGVNGEFVVSPRFKLAAGYTYQKTSGQSDLAIPAIGGTFVAQQDVPQVDDVKIHTFQVKGVFKVSRNIDVTGGYAYEKYEYNDTAFANYTYVVPANPVGNRAYLSGLWAFNDYKMNLVYAYLTYRF